MYLEYVSSNIKRRHAEGRRQRKRWIRDRPSHRYRRREGALALLFDVRDRSLQAAGGAPGTVTSGFCDIAFTIVLKLKVVPEINAVLMEADTMPSLAASARNVFDSLSRWQVIMNKTGANVESKVWLAGGGGGFTR